MSEDTAETSNNPTFTYAFDLPRKPTNLTTSPPSLSPPSPPTVVKNKLEKVKAVSKKIINLSKLEADLIGSGLSLTLLSNTTSDGAVDEWVMRYPALQELDEDAVWFRPMMNTVARRLLGEAGWGLKFRVYIGAGLSIMDMFSDVAMINEFVQTENYFFAKAICSCVVLNL